MRRRVAEVDGERLAAVTLDHAAQTVVDGPPGLVPRHLDVHAVAFDEWSAQPIRILVELTQCGALRTDEALGEHVLAVAADPGDVFGAVGVTPDRDLETTAGLAERTRAERGAGGLHGLSCRHRPRLARDRHAAMIRRPSSETRAGTA